MLLSLLLAMAVAPIAEDTASMSEATPSERPMSPSDVARLAGAVLVAIERGEVEADTADLAFLRSLADVPTSAPS